MKRLLGRICLATALLGGGGCAGSSSPSPRSSASAAAPVEPSAPTRQPTATAAPSDAAAAPADAGTKRSPDNATASAPTMMQPAEFNSMASGEDRVIARVGGQTIRFGELLRPMMEAHGLEFLMQLVQLHTAENAARQNGIVVSEDDIAREREYTLSRLFRDVEEKTREQIDDAVAKGDAQKAEQLRAEMMRQREGLIDQFLQQQYMQTRNYMSRQEFDILLRTNAYLRKLSEAAPAVRAEIPEEELRKDFATLYGEKAVVRHIQLSNLQEVVEAKRRLASGQTFAEVAAAVSRNKQTGPLGGELPPFTQNSEEIPEAFRQVAFTLAPGQVSDPIQTGDAFHLLKLEQRIPPRAVKFEGVRDVLQRQRRERMVQFAMNQLRQTLAQRARDTMKIEDPLLQQQFVQRLEAQQAKVRQQDEIRRQLQREREQQPPTTGPSDNTGPYTPTTRPGSAAPLSPLPQAPTTRPTTEVPPAGPQSGGFAAPAPATRPAPGAANP